MKIRGIFIILLVGIILTVNGPNGQACDRFGISGLLPESNNTNIPVFENYAAGINESLYNEIIDEIEVAYAPVYEWLGKSLYFMRQWENDKVNAYSGDVDGVIMVAVNGGLARHFMMKPDALRLAICHELGHTLGGVPHRRSFSGWNSTEGQADYWGVLKCLRRLWEHSDNHTIVSKMFIPKIITSKCQSVFKTTEALALCQRSAMAGLSLSEFFRVAMKKSSPVMFKTPDLSVVGETSIGYPSVQCRGDTFLQASLCSKKMSDHVSQTIYQQGTCTRAEAYTVGVRPLCWFHPPTKEVN